MFSPALPPLLLMQARKEQMANEHGGDVHAAYAEMGSKVRLSCVLQQECVCRSVACAGRQGRFGGGG